MLKCKLCGHEVKYRLIEHILKKHSDVISLDEYKERYGEVVSEEYREKYSNIFKNKWKDDEYREKQREKAHIKYTDDVKAVMSEKYKKALEDGRIKFWNKGLTKYDDERLKQIGENNKNKLTGRTKENYEYLKKHSELMKKISVFSRDNPVNNFSEDQKNEWRKKISETISRKISTGEINGKSNFKSGWFFGDNKKVWYQSGLELSIMTFLEENKFNWKRCIDRVLYQREDGTYHYYLPDFEILYNNKRIVFESKGFPDPDIYAKEIESRKIFECFFICYSLDELKLKLKEIIDNEIC